MKRSTISTFIFFSYNQTLENVSGNFFHRSRSLSLAQIYHAALLQPPAKIRYITSKRSNFLLLPKCLYCEFEKARDCVCNGIRTSASSKRLYYYSEKQKASAIRKANLYKVDVLRNRARKKKHQRRRFVFIITKSITFP